MVKNSPRYVCQDCGASYVRWIGKCESCGTWNSIAEEAHAIKELDGGRNINFVDLNGDLETLPPRLLTNITEFDRVCGGGLISGSAILIGGDPGIGKSTLLLQALATISWQSNCIYISGEESIDQVRLRARRLNMHDAPVQLAATIILRDIIASLNHGKAPKVVVIDSIQTMYSDNLDSAPGSVSQVRNCASELIHLAKRRGFILFLVGHITKDGQIAGPRILEHMVDTVLYFEGERGHPFRILRSVKNRFGATDEIGVFEMDSIGLTGITNPSALFLAERRGNVSGSCVFAGIEGTRPMLVEIQALVVSSALGTPRRAVIGWDGGRLSMLLAVLDARCNLALSRNDIYLNVAGGLRISEPAADLAVAIALLSSVNDIPVNADTVTFGEIGLPGEIRAVNQMNVRLKEATKLGFTKALIPVSRKQIIQDQNDHDRPSIDIHHIGHVHDLISLFRHS
ncbi:MAG: DNA repair protein RadA [Rhodospirillaceae bacterium]|nr:DNA repair protein RadA [Rhodospirillaceae bacterium]